MNLNYKLAFALSFSLLLMVIALPGISISAPAHTSNLPDSIPHESKIREVLTSQQLFIVEMSPMKGKKAKEKNLFNVKAENRDAFMILCYDNGPSIKELDWTMCPDGECPTVGTYKWGTKEYAQLDSLIKKVKSYPFKPVSRR